MVAQDPVRLSEARLAWANSIDESTGLVCLALAWANSNDKGTGLVRLALAWANSNDESLGMFAWRSLGSRLSEGVFAWAKHHLTVQKVHATSNPFHPKTQFWSPITQNKSLQLFTGSICNIAFKTTQNYALNNRIINIFTKYQSF